MPQVRFDGNNLTLDSQTGQSPDYMILKDLGGSGEDQQIHVDGQTPGVTGDNEYIQVTTADGSDTYKYTNNVPTNFNPYSPLLVVWNGDVISISDATGQIKALYMRT